jgi:hypothetical protein
MVGLVAVPVDAWDAPLSLGFTVGVPVACFSGLFAPANNGSSGLLKKVTAAADPDDLATTAIPSGGVAIASDATVLVPEITKTLSRWTATGAPVEGWQTPDLGGAPRTPVVLAHASNPFTTATANGLVHTLRSDGTIAWTGQLGTAALQPGNIFTPPQPADGHIVSYAYFAGADGVLHAVIVDGQLDTSAPWPKAFHDPQNTNRAGAQP